MINSFNEGESQHLPSDNDSISETFEDAIEKLVAQKFPALQSFQKKQKELIEKTNLANDLKRRYKELDDESFELSDGKKLNTPKEEKDRIMTGLKKGKMDIFELQKKVQKELELLSLSLQDTTDKMIDEISAFNKMKEDLQKKYRKE